MKPKSIEKPVKTRWNSYVRSFRRGVEIQEAFSAYIDYHVDLHRTDLATRRARRRNVKGPDAPRWVKNGGLSSDNWQVIVEYIGFLKPLENATRRLQGKGKSGRWGEIWEVIPTFDSILQVYEDEKNRLEEVDYDADWAPEVHFKTNINLGWSKLHKYGRNLTTRLLTTPPSFYMPRTSSTAPTLGLTNQSGSPNCIQCSNLSGPIIATRPRLTRPTPPKRVRIETGIDAIIKKKHGHSRAHLEHWR